MGFIRHSDDRSSNICGFNVIQIEISTVKIRISTRKCGCWLQKADYHWQNSGFWTTQDGVTNYTCLCGLVQSEFIGMKWSSTQEEGSIFATSHAKVSMAQYCSSPCRWLLELDLNQSSRWVQRWANQFWSFWSGEFRLPMRCCWEKEDCCEMNLILDCNGLTSNYRSFFAWMSGCWFGGLWNCRMWKVRFWCTMRLFLSNSCELLQHRKACPKKWYVVHGKSSG